MSVQEITARIVDFVIERVVKISKSETKDLVVDHELLGVAPEMIDWWWLNMSTTEHYKLWHPKDHVWAKEEIKEDNGKTVITQHVLEKVGGLPNLFLIRLEDPDASPISREYSHAFAATVCSLSGNAITLILHQYEEMPGGTRMRSTFRLPAKAPGFFVKGLRKHNQEEMGQFPVFLPELYKAKA